MTTEITRVRDNSLFFPLLSSPLGPEVLGPRSEIILDMSPIYDVHPLVSTPRHQCHTFIGTFRSIFIFSFYFFCDKSLFRFITSITLVALYLLWDSH